MQNLVSRLLPTIEHFTLLGYWIVLLVSLAESLAFIGILIPGTTIIVLVGFLASKGAFDIGDLIWFVTVGAILGDGLSFYLGKRGKMVVRPTSTLFNAARMESATQFFQRHGGKSVFLGRFIGPMRAIIPFVAGMSGMNQKLFLIWNITSALLWAIMYLLLGYFFGHAWKIIETWSTRVSLLAIALILSILGIFWLKRFVAKRGAQIFLFIASLLKSLKNAIIDNPDVQQLVRRYPGAFGWLKARFQTDRFSGVTLSLLSLAFLYTLALFFGIIEDLVMSDSIIEFDLRLHNLLYMFRHPLMVRVFLWITLLGKSTIIISASLMASLLFWLNRQHHYIAPFWLVIIGSTAFAFMGKLAFHRPRPEFSVYTESSYSFPSGHATIAVAFYGIIIYILWKQLDTWIPKLNSLFLGICLIFAIGFSRIYLGEHFFSDVWAGYLLGTLWLIIGISVVEWLPPRERSPRKSFFPSRRQKTISGVLILAELAFYVILAFQYAPPSTALPPPKETTIADASQVFSSEHAPRYTETITGKQQEPLTLLILARDDEQFSSALRQAGWFPAEAISITSIFTIAKAALLNEEYLTAPISPYFWNARPHDIGLQKPTAAQSVRERHHVRFWRTHYLTENGRRLYVGTASLDIGIKWGMIHRIQPDIDTERDLVLNDLSQAGQVKHAQTIQFVDPTLGSNAYNDPFFTNGHAYIITLNQLFFK